MRRGVFLLPLLGEALSHRWVKFAVCRWLHGEKEGWANSLLVSRVVSIFEAGCMCSYLLPTYHRCSSYKEQK